jgi:hypothetical protein
VLVCTKHETVRARYCDYRSVHLGPKVAAPRHVTVCKHLQTKFHYPLRSISPYITLPTLSHNFFPYLPYLTTYISCNVILRDNYEVELVINQFYLYLKALALLSVSGFLIPTFPSLAAVPLYHPLSLGAFA